MYIALGCMVLGIICGHIFGALLSRRLLDGLLYLAVLWLLFILGAQIGGNERLFSALPQLGLQAAAITVCAIAGSLGVARLFEKLTAGKNER